MSFAELLGLRADKFFVIEIIDSHSTPHLCKSLSGYRPRCLCPFPEHLIHARNILLELFPALTDRFQFRLQYGIQELLYLHIPESASSVVVLQFVQAGIVRQEFREMFRPAECIQICEHRVPFDLPRVFYLYVSRVREHAHHLFPDIFLGIGQVDAVPERLAHLGLSIGPRQAQTGGIVRKQDFRLHKGFSIYGIEFPDYLPRLLDHRLLVLSDRYCRGLESRYVRSLAYGICEESYRNAGLEIAHLDLRLDGRIPLQSRHCHEIHVVECQFTQLSNLRLDENGAPGRVESAGQVVESHLYDIVPYLARIVRIVGKRLCIGDHYEYPVEFSGILQLHPSFQGTHIVSEMQPSRRPVSRKYDFLLHLLYFQTETNIAIFILNPSPFRLSSKKFKTKFDIRYFLSVVHYDGNVSHICGTEQSVGYWM